MRISFLGNFGVDYSSESQYAKTLESMGREVIKLQENEPIEEAPDCDVFIWVHTHNWRSPGIEKLIEKYKGKVPIVSYHLDLWRGLDRQKDLEDDPFYKLIDHWFVTDKLMADWLNEETEVEGHYLPAGVFEEEVIMLDKSDQKVPEVAFIGSKGYHPEWAYRPMLINWLEKTYGDNFGHYSGEEGTLGLKRGLHLNQLLADTKIVVGDSLCIGFNYPYYISDRLFEITGRGGFLIMPYIKGIEDFFEDGKEIILYEYGDFRQLEFLIDYYLNHDEERELIRKAGFERAKKDHTYVLRWEQIFKELGL